MSGTNSGHNGVRPDLVDHLVKMLNCNVLLVIPEKDSVGCSGDLVPGWLRRSPAFRAWSFPWSTSEIIRGITVYPAWI